MTEDIEKLFPLIPELRDKKVTYKALGGGLTNRNYKLDVDGVPYVLRIAGAGTGLLGIDRQREVACSRAAAAAGVGPDIIAFLPEHAAMLSQFVKGKLLSEQDIRQPDTLRRAAQAIRRCHDQPVPADLGVFCVFTTVRNYDALARSRGVPLPSSLDQCLALLGRIERELGKETPCLCHNDLLAANFIDDGKDVRIIDWEYAGLGQRFFDLGNFAVNNQLNAEEESRFLEAYFGAARPDDLRRLRLMRLASDMREATWGLVQSAISKLHPPEHYLDYGRKHLARFLAAAANLGVA